MPSRKMKKIASLLFIAVCSILPKTGNAQSRLVEPNQESASAACQYYTNLGQITDDTGGTHPEVLYYTEHGSPSVFLENNKMHFVTYNYGNDAADDSTYRITMEFKCSTYGTETSCGSIQPYEAGSDVLNYYNPYAAPGITGVTGYAGIVYQNAFMNTDFHFYSNSLGMKNFIRFKPMSNPNDFILKFTGQDSIYVVDSMLQAYVGQRVFTLPIVDAYQIDAFNNVYPLSWTPHWVDNGSGEVGINLPFYDPSKDLVIRIGGVNVTTYDEPSGNLDWATYYGGTESENYPHVVSNANRELYHAMAKVGGDFPNQTGAAGTTNGTYLSGFDTYVSKFDANANRIWGTYYGGTAHDVPHAIVETKDPDNAQGGFVFVGGTTKSTDLIRNTNSGFNQTTFGGGDCDGYLASFNKSTGVLLYNTYFGGADSDEIFALAADDNDARLYFGGKTSSSSSSTNCTTPSSASFSLCAGSGTRYYQSTIGGGSDGFIASLNTSTNGLTWSSYYGGSGWEQLQTLALMVSKGTHAIYAGGTSTSNSVSASSFPSPITSPSSTGTFPLADPGSGAYFQKSVVHASTPYDGEGFIARFDANHKLSWSTYFGGNQFDGVWKLSLNKTTGDLYASGCTETSNASNNSSSANNLGKFPVYTSSTSHYSHAFTGLTSSFIARFSPTQQLKWSTYFGGGNYCMGIGLNPCDVEALPNGDVILSGYAQLATPTNGELNDVYAAPAAYNQPYNASNALCNPGATQADSNPVDGWVAQFNANNGKKWITYFGGAQKVNLGASSDPIAQEQITAIAVGGTANNLTLFATGLTRCAFTPVLNNGGYFQRRYNSNNDIFIARFSSVQNVGVNDLDAVTSHANLSVMPNPSTGSFLVGYQALDAGMREAHVHVLNAMGQVVLKDVKTLSAGSAKFELQLGNVPAGMYLLSVNGEASVKLIKQ
jgi:hypothetical protein